MAPKYKHLFLFFLSLTLVAVLVLLYLTRTKPPSLDKKNFFTVSARSPEYLLQPINPHDLLVPPEMGYPTVNISPNNKLYPLFNFISDWEFGKKKNDNLFLASKKISELIKWGNEMPLWDKHLKSYEGLINQQIKIYSEITNPIIRLNQFLTLNSELLSRRQKIEQVIYLSNKSLDQQKLLQLLVDNIFDSAFKKLEDYLPTHRNGNTIYSLLNPLLDREFGFYEGQWIINGLSTGDLKDIEINGKSDFLYWDNLTPAYPLSLIWHRSPDNFDENNPTYVAEISTPALLQNSALAVFTSHFKKLIEIRIQHITQGTNLLFFESVYPKPHPVEFKRIFSVPKKTDQEEKIEIKIHVLNQSAPEVEKYLKQFSLVLYQFIDPEYPLLITKKFVTSEKNSVFSYTKIDPFRYQLNIPKTSLFDNRQIKYNLGFTWQIDNNKVIYYLPGIIIFRLMTIFCLLSFFYGLCLLLNKSLDSYLTNIIKQTFILIKKYYVFLFTILKKLFSYTRLWFFILAIITLIGETFLHSESYSALVFITVILWLLSTIGYNLDSTVSLLFSFCLFGFTVLFLILKMEVIADKFALWTIIFLIINVIGSFLEFTQKKQSYNLKHFFAEIIKEWHINVKRFRLLKTIIYKKIKSLTAKDLILICCKITITIAIIISFILLRNIYKKNLQRRSLIPFINKAEPKIVYHSTKFILFGKSFGSRENKKSRLMSSYGELSSGFWTDSKIIYSVPLEWKPGEVNIWVEKQIIIDNKKTSVKSKVVKLKVIPRGNTFTPDDDLFFEQLKTLDKETLEVNGYK